MNWTKQYLRQVILPLSTTTAVILGAAAISQDASANAQNACAELAWEIDGCEVDRRQALDYHCITEDQYEFLRRTDRVPLCNEFEEYYTDCDCDESAARERRRLAEERAARERAERERVARAERERRAREAERRRREEEARRAAERARERIWRDHCLRTGACF